MHKYLSPTLISNPHTQSILASIPPRRWLVERRTREFRTHSHCVTLDCGKGVRLQGFFTSHTESCRRNEFISPVAVLIHGWEGCSDSLYMLSAGSALYARGYDVVRLNLRDHGNTHHLNTGLFHSCRIDEAVGAVKAIQSRFPDRDICLAGFSLGGNFALRIALRTEQNDIDLLKVAAICPVLSPANTLRAMEQRGRRIYHNYFLRRWLESLQKKHRLFPQTYDLDMIRANTSLRDLTHYLVQTHTEYACLEDYLEGYSICGDVLSALTIPADMLLSRDDPVIPIADLDKITKPEKLQIIVTEQGGHCAFLSDYTLSSWMDEYIVQAFSEAIDNPIRREQKASSTTGGLAHRSQAL